MLTKDLYQNNSGKTLRMAQLDHALIDVNFFSKPKIKGLRYKHGELAALYLVKIILELSGATQATISQEAALATAQETGIAEDKAEDILAYCIDNGILEVAGSGITQQRVVEDQQSLFEKREATRLRVNKKRIGNALQSRTSDTDTVTDPDLDLDLKEDRVVLEIDEISLEQLKCANGPELVQRAVELAEAHINSKKGTPEFHSLKAAARNGAAYLGSWALSKARIQLANEAAASDRQKKKPPDFEAQKQERKQRELDAARKRDLEKGNK